MIREDEVYKIGQLGKPHGVRGEISFAFTDDVWDRVEAPYLFVMVDNILVPFFLEEWRFRSDSVALLKFQGTDTCEQAQQWRNLDVYFPYALCPQDEEGELTWQGFVGYHVIDGERGDVGAIESVYDSTENILLELEGGRLIPATEDFITDIDHETHRLMMRLPEGLLDI